MYLNVADAKFGASAFPQNPPGNSTVDCGGY